MKLIRNSAIILVIISVVAFFTNPTLESFKAKSRGELMEKLTVPAVAQNIPGADVFTEMADTMMNQMCTRNDYYLFSLYTVEVPMHEPFNYLGIFGIFIPLQKESPLDLFDPLNER